jgi:hypothetical protein
MVQLSFLSQKQKCVCVCVCVLKKKERKKKMDKLKPYEVKLGGVYDKIKLRFFLLTG